MKKLLILTLVLVTSSKTFAMVPKGDLLIANVKLEYTRAELDNRENGNYNCRNFHETNKQLIEHRVDSFIVTKTSKLLGTLYALIFGASGGVAAKSAYDAACPHEDCDTTQAITYGAISGVNALISFYFGVSTAKNALYSTAAQNIKGAINNHLNPQFAINTELIAEPLAYQSGLYRNVIRSIEDKPKTKIEIIVAKNLVDQLRKDLAILQQDLKPRTQVSQELPEPV